jgi:hypothetical protein
MRLAGAADKSTGDRLLSGLAAGKRKPAGSPSYMPVPLDSCAVLREKCALCGHFSSNLRYFVGNLGAKRVKMLSRQ